MKKKYVLISELFIILVLLIIGVPVAAADNETSSNTVTEITARNVAQYYVNGYSKVIPVWTGGVVEKLVTYYSDDEIKSGHEFTIQKITNR